MFRPLALFLGVSLTGGCAHARIEQLETDLAASNQQVSQLQTQNAGYVADISALQAEIAGLRGKNAELAAFYEGIVQEFQGEFAEGDAALVIFPDRGALVLGDQLSFASGSAELTPDGKAAIDKLARILADHPGRRFQVEGHTDPLPIATARYPSNWELGADRAVRIVRELVARGVPASQLSAATYADTSPFAANDQADGQAVNRRIAVALQTTLEETGAQRQLYASAQAAGRGWYAATPSGPTVAGR